MVAGDIIIIADTTSTKEMLRNYFPSSSQLFLSYWTNASCKNIAGMSWAEV